MTQIAERPLASEGDPSEWLEELVVAEALRDSSEWIESRKALHRLMEAEYVAKLRKAREAREAEDAFQKANAEAIRLENEAEARRITAAACPSCFCIHAGEC